MTDGQMDIVKSIQNINRIQNVRLLFRFIKNFLNSKQKYDVNHESVRHQIVLRIKKRYEQSVVNIITLIVDFESNLSFHSTRIINRSLRIYIEIFF